LLPSLAPTPQPQALTGAARLLPGSTAAEHCLYRC
jgi:hypothetical protein